jgi:hypothetical protein
MSGKKKDGRLVGFLQQKCKNHMRQNVGKEKYKLTCFGIFLQKLPISKL